MKLCSNHSQTTTRLSTFLSRNATRLACSFGTLLLCIVAPAASFGGVQYEKIGDPVFEIVGHVSGSTAVPRSLVLSQPTWERTLDDIFGPEYLVKTAPNTGSAPAIPTIVEPLDMPVDEHVRRSVAASGMINTDVFSVREMFWDRSRLGLLILSPTGAAPDGASPQDANGPVIPNDLFPLRSHRNHELHQNGSIVDRFSSSPIPALESRGLLTDADGIQHDFTDLNYGDLIIPNTLSAGRAHSIDSLVADYEQRYSVLDKNGNGWRITESFTTVRSPTNILGDLNYNGEFDAHDLKILTQNVAVAPAEPQGLFLRRLDLNRDRLVDASDVHFWITDLKSTYVGDTNLDGEVKFDDFLTLSANFGQAGGWAEGDFNADEIVNFPDFLALSANFGSVAAGNASAAAVPEPTASGIALFGLLGLIGFRKRR